MDIVDKINLLIKTKFIKLDQLLKLANFVTSGSEGKFIIEEGKVFVNEKLELRRGRKIFLGDRVKYGDKLVIIKPSGIFVKNEEDIKES